MEEKQRQRVCKNPNNTDMYGLSKNAIHRLAQHKDCLLFFSDPHSLTSILQDGQP